MPIKTNIEIKPYSVEVSKRVPFGKSEVDGVYLKSLSTAAGLANLALRSTSAADCKTNGEKLLQLVTGNPICALDALVLKSEGMDDEANIARGQVELLSQAICIAMRDGATAVDGLTKAVESGDVSRIETVLATPLKPLAREVRNLVVTNSDIATVMDNAEAVAMEDYGDSLARLPFRESREIWELVLDRLKSLRKDTGSGIKIPKGHQDEGQWKNAMRYVRERLSISPPVLKEVNLGGGGEISLPMEKEAQLTYVRSLIENVESTARSTQDYYVGQYSATLEKIAKLPNVDSSVALEIRSRLALHDCWILMKKANGYIEAPKSGADPECPTVGSAAAQAAGRGHELNSESIKFFLKGDTNGLFVSNAWDIYQDVNVDYRAILEEVERMDGKSYTDNMRVVVDNDPDMGTQEVNYLTDSDSVRKARVDKYVVETLLKGRDGAAKAWDLAKKLGLATGENSIFFSALTGNDEMAEDIFLKVYRKGRDDKGRPRGPQIHLDKIAGIGNSWLRKCSGVEPYDSMGRVPLYAKDVVVETNTGSGDGIEEGSYVNHFCVWWSGKIHPLRVLLMEREPDPKKYINYNLLQQAVDYFNKADPKGVKNLRFLWVAGVLDMACSFGDLGWTTNDLSRFRQQLLKPLSESVPSFISQDDWNRLERTYGFVNKMAKLELKRVGQSMFDAFTGASSSRGK